MAKGEAIERWRDEDGPPSPSEEWTNWWEKEAPRRIHVEGTYPPDHEDYLNELYEEIRTLRLRVAELEAELEAAAREDGAAT